MLLSEFLVEGTAALHEIWLSMKLLLHLEIFLSYSVSLLLKYYSFFAKRHILSRLIIYATWVVSWLWILFRRTWEVVNRRKASLFYWYVVWMDTRLRMMPILPHHIRLIKTNRKISILANNMLLLFLLCINAFF